MVTAAPFFTCVPEDMLCLITFPVATLLLYSYVTLTDNPFSVRVLFAVASVFPTTLGMAKPAVPLLTVIFTVLPGPASVCASGLCDNTRPSATVSLS